MAQDNDTEQGGDIICPECGERTEQVEMEESGVGVDLLLAGDTVVMGKTNTLIEYTFSPCGHTAYGTKDLGDSRSLRVDSDAE